MQPWLVMDPPRSLCLVAGVLDSDAFYAFARGCNALSRPVHGRRRAPACRAADMADVCHMLEPAVHFARVCGTDDAWRSSLHRCDCTFGVVCRRSLGSWMGAVGVSVRYRVLRDVHGGRFCATAAAGCFVMDVPPDQDRLCAIPG